MARQVIGSNFGKLDKNLLIKVYECDESGVITPDSVIVQGAIPQGGFTVQYTAQWQQPFEQSGVENKAPAVAALLQTGQLKSLADGVIGGLLSPEVAQSLGVGTDEGQILGILDTLKNRSGVTVLNSRQVFSAQPAFEVSATILFRAWSDTGKEVEIPIEQVITWFTMKKISKDSRILGIGAGLASLDLNAAILAAFPSEIPSFVGVTYGGKNYSPLVITSIQDDNAVQRDAKGRLSAELPVQFSSLTAFDREMRAEMLKRKPQ